MNKIEICKSAILWLKKKLPKELMWIFAVKRFHHCLWIVSLYCQRLMSYPFDVDLGHFTVLLLLG